VVRWQRRLRLGLGLFAGAFTALLWLVAGERHRPAASPPPVERLDPAARSEIHGGDVLQHKGATRNIRVQFGSQIAYPDGRLKLTTFSAFIDDRDGRSFVISGAEALVGKDLSAYDLRGNVTLSTSDGLTATTPAATFAEAEGVVRGAGPVGFRRGRVTGSGVGFTYDRTLDRLWLLDRAGIEVAPGPDGLGGMRVSAGSAGYSRRERYMRLERTVRIDRDDQAIEAGQATVFLLADRDEPEHVELRGSSRVIGARSAALREMRAQDMNLRYAGDGRTLREASLWGGATVGLGRADGAPGQTLSADRLDASLGDDGTLRRVAGRDRARVDLPATSEAAPRTITAQSVDGTGQAGRGLTALEFDGGVEYRDEGARSSPVRIARARGMKAALSPGGTVDTAEFLGAFRFEEGRLGATSATAQYNVTAGTLTLAGEGGGRPHAADERVTIDADRIDVALSPRQMTASGAVRVELAAGRRREGERGTSLLGDREAVVVTAESVSIGESVGTFKGQAHLFQPSGTSIRADGIALDERQGTLGATGGVVSTLPVAGRREAGPGATSVARGGALRFDDARRQAVLSDSAELTGVHGALRAGLITLFLAPRDNTLERLEAEDRVTVTVDKRQATGSRLAFDPGAEQYVLNGSPVRLVQECQESTGRTLTFWRASDRILVDGNEEVRVQTRGGKCPEPRDPRVR
jgi:lipopolysaccharide export system protein LptA